MAWGPKQLADISFILVGPILRKVTPHSVNVFIVTKENCQARIKIYQRNGSNPASLIATGTNAGMVQIGAHMYVNVLSVNVSSAMESGITYGYDIEFTIGSNTYNFWNIESYDGIGGFLNIGITTLSFNINGTNQFIPSFVLPPIDATKLRVLHGSCRKAHGEGLDAMTNAGSILLSTVTNPDTVTDPTQRRPQMMFLTGDQIYSDDVSDIMLYMIDKYAQLLLGWDEDLASLGCDVNNLAPGKRAPNIKNVAKFSVDEEVAGSHLMKLREFILMYCMTWSNVLWQEDQTKPGIPVLPSFEDLYPGEEETEHIPLDPLGIVTVAMGKSEKYETYTKHVVYINRLFQSVNNHFRMILANIPLYMILDDHEITDDLFYNGKWFQDAVENSPLGKRICTNGMAAYALFQDWGNKPEDYLTGTIGRVLINFVAGLRIDSGNTSVWNTMSSIVLPILDRTSTPARFRHLGPAIDGTATSLNWNYYYEVSNVYEFIVLDTRTMRVFHNELNGIPGLLSDDALKIQIENQGSDKSKPLIFVISPTPVIEVNRVQRNKEVPLHLHISNKYELDFENWSSDSKSNEHFYSILFTRNTNRRFLQVILLGGDVHYAYSSRMQYWASKTYIESAADKNMAIAGLCASSFKNEVSAANAKWYLKIRMLEGYTKGLHPYILDKLRDKSAIYGWENKSESSFVVKIYLSPASSIPTLLFTMGKSPFLFDRDRRFKEDQITGIINNPAHEWQYRIYPQSRINPGFVPSPGNGSSLSSYKKYVQAHREAYEKSGNGGRYIVGYNNMGDIVLESGSQGIGFVYHRIWWANDEDRKFNKTTSGFPDVGGPYTIHKIDMGLYNEPNINEL